MWRPRGAPPRQPQGAHPVEAGGQYGPRRGCESLFNEARCRRKGMPDSRILRSAVYTSEGGPGIAGPARGQDHLDRL